MLPAHPTQSLLSRDYRLPLPTTEWTLSYHYHDSAQRDETATIPSRDVAGLALLLTNPYLRERRCGLKLLVRARDFVSTPLVQV